MDYTYRKVSAKTFDETVAAVEREASGHGFVMMHVHDISAALTSKGFPIRPLRIFELDRQDAGVDPGDLEMLMPCRINIYVEDDEVVVAAIRPSVATVLFPEAALTDLAAYVERHVEALVDRCVTL